MKLIPLDDVIFVTDLEATDRFVGKIFIPNDNAKTQGIKPRWGKVYAVGKNVDYLKPGEWIYVGHGRWSRKVTLEIDGKEIGLWTVDPKDIWLVTESETKPEELV